MHLSAGRGLPLIFLFTGDMRAGKVGRRQRGEERRGQRLDTLGERRERGERREERGRGE
jgi:hypothetical protein